jgi:hypothetical protein
MYLSCSDKHFCWSQITETTHGFWTKSLETESAFLLIINVQQIEDAMRYKLGRFLDGDDFEDVKNDFLDIIRALKRQIFQVFKEAGIWIANPFSNYHGFNLTL